VITKKSINIPCITCVYRTGAVKQIWPSATDHSSPTDWHTTYRWQYDEHVTGGYIPDLTMSPSHANCNTQIHVNRRPNLVETLQRTRGVFSALEAFFATMRYIN